MSLGICHHVASPGRLPRLPQPQAKSGDPSGPQRFPPSVLEQSWFHAPCAEHLSQLGVDPVKRCLNWTRPSCLRSLSYLWGDAVSQRWSARLVYTVPCREGSPRLVPGPLGAAERPCSPKPTHNPNRCLICAPSWVPDLPPVPLLFPQDCHNLPVSCSRLSDILVIQQTANGAGS